MFHVSIEISYKFIIFSDLKIKHFNFAVFIFGAIHEASTMKDLDQWWPTFMTGRAKYINFRLVAGRINNFTTKKKQ